MPPTSRIFLAVTLTAALALAAQAQDAATTETTQKATATSAAKTDTSTSTAEKGTTTAGEGQDVDETPRSEQVRAEFERVLRAHPPELGTILALDPTLLSNEAFLNGYPKVATFAREHPEVRRNPKFFLSEFEQRPVVYRESTLDEVLEGLFTLTIMGLVAFLISWIMRTIIEQRRWNRLTQTQTEVHTKILDRLGSSEELLTYMQSPAGVRFLESAPIPLQAAERPAVSAPLSRILWSVQVGVIIAVGSIGLMLVSSRFNVSDAQPLFALGVIAMSIGVGFIASAFVSLTVSRRLGLWKEQQAAEPHTSGLVQ